jgi:hypothetical protein
MLCLTSESWEFVNDTIVPDGKMVGLVLASQAGMLREQHPSQNEQGKVKYSPPTQIAAKPCPTHSSPLARRAR